ALTSSSNKQTTTPVDDEPWPEWMLEVATAYKKFIAWCSTTLVVAIIALFAYLQKSARNLFSVGKQQGQRIRPNLQNVSLASIGRNVLKGADNVRHGAVVGYENAR